MGMYDTVVISCPDCGFLVEEQSKAGECCLLFYGAMDVPTDIANDVIGTTLSCEACFSVFKVMEVLPIPIETKSLVGIKI